MYAIAVIFGASIGVLLAYSTGLRGSSLVFGATMTAYIAGVATFHWLVNAPGGVMVALVAAQLLTSLLIAGEFWKGHPLLEGANYWGRMSIVFWHQTRLRESASNDPDAAGQRRPQEESSPSS